MEDIDYDVCIIGGGPAGLTAAIYTGRYGLRTILISKDIGGTANLAGKLENYPGFVGSGVELMKIFYKQAENSGAEILNLEVVDLDKDEIGFAIKLKNNKILHSKILIIALGTEKRKLNIEGEEKFIGKGVSYCAECDAPFFKNKITAVIGGRNSASKAALLLSKIAKKVYIIYRQNELKCEEAEKNKIGKEKKIELVLNSFPLEVKGKEKVESLIVDIKGKKKEIELDGVFVEIGAIPVSSITKQLGIKTDREGYIEVDTDMKTNVPGIFAAGDTIKSKLKQVVISASQGALAAYSAREYLCGK